MKCTKINVWTTSSSTILGTGSVEFDNVFYVKFTIMKSNRDASLFVSWPSKKGKAQDGSEKWYSDAGFVIDEKAESPYAFKNEVENEIIRQFNQKAGNTKATQDKKETSQEDPPFDADPPKEPVRKTPLVKFRK